MRGSRLVVQMPGRPDAVLEPIDPDIFTGGVFDALQFLRDANGSVVAAALHASGVRGLRFDRIKPAGPAHGADSAVQVPVEPSSSDLGIS